MLFKVFWVLCSISSSPYESISGFFSSCSSSNFIKSFFL
jgi:hypothetical protein